MREQQTSKAWDEQPGAWIMPRERPRALADITARCKGTVVAVIPSQAAGAAPRSLVLL